jgi:glycosyltransferase involved in cell wall biosynthesis
MARHYTIIHFWPVCGGFGKRMEMLEETLRRAGTVRRLCRFSGLLGWLRSDELRCGHDAAIIYTSLLAPLAVLLRILRPQCPIFYMVRGDEIDWARHDGRRLRAGVALVFQMIMQKLNCRFVFASWDLEELFIRRLGPLVRRCVMPNTLGRPVGLIRPFDGRIAVVGDFNTVKNVEWALENLGTGLFQVDLYGNRSLPEQFRRPWLRAHGRVSDLTAALGNASLLLLTSRSECFPNVMLDALQSGCGVAVPREFPFRWLPIADAWRFDLSAGPSRAGQPTALEQFLLSLYAQGRDFREDNRQLIELVESDWAEHVWRALS